MTDEALAELARVPSAEACSADVQQLRAYILMRARRWGDALAACEELRSGHPDQPLGFIHSAFCLHELGRTEEAMGLLLAGPASLLREPIYFYNLGCYHAVLGRPDEAENYLRMSFDMDGKFREIARYDPDLASVASRF